MNRKRALQALHDARVHGATLVFDAHDARFQMFVEEEWGVGGRYAWLPSWKLVLVYMAVFGVYDGLIFGIVLLRVWVEGGGVPPILSLAVWCCGGSQVYGFIFYVFKVALTNRTHYVVARDCGGVAALSHHSVCFNGQVFLRPLGGLTTFAAFKSQGKVPYITVAVPRRRRYDFRQLTSINVPSLDAQHEQAIMSTR